MSARLVVDSSALCALCFEDERSEHSTALLDALEGGEIWAPALVLWEVGNVLLMAERRRRISQAERVQALRLMNDLGLNLDPPSSVVVWNAVVALAEQTGLTSYDAAYLELALRLETPLASRDQQLIEQAQRLGVPLQPC
jgi:predicted nucleic acid-binding protein